MNHAYTADIFRLQLHVRIVCTTARQANKERFSLVESSHCLISGWSTGQLHLREQDCLLESMQVKSSRSVR
jgi:hypothetical protein